MANSITVGSGNFFKQPIWKRSEDLVAGNQNLAKERIAYYHLRGRKIEKILNTVSTIIFAISVLATEALIGVSAVYKLLNQWAAFGILTGGGIVLKLFFDMFHITALNIKEHFLNDQRQLKLQHIGTRSLTLTCNEYKVIPDHPTVRIIEPDLYQKKIEVSRVKEDLLADPTYLEPVDTRIAHHNRKQAEILGEQSISLRELQLRSDRLGLVDTAVKCGAMAKLVGNKELVKINLKSPLPSMWKFNRKAPDEEMFEQQRAQLIEIWDLLGQLRAVGFCKYIEKYEKGFRENLTKSGYVSVEALWKKERLATFCTIHRNISENTKIIAELRANLPDALCTEFKEWLERSRSMEECFTTTRFSLRDLALGKQVRHLLKDEEGKAALLKHFSAELTAAGKGLIEKDLNKLTDDAIAERLFSLDSDKKWEVLDFLEGQITKKTPNAPVYIGDLIDLRIGLEELSKDTKTDFENRVSLLAKRYMAVESAIATEKRGFFSQIVGYLATRKPDPFEKTNDRTLRAIHSNLKMLDRKLFRLRMVSYLVNLVIVGLAISTMIVPHPAYFFPISGVILIYTHLAAPALFDRRIKKLEGQITDLRMRELIHLKRGAPTVDAFTLDKQPKNAEAVKEFKKSQAEIDKAHKHFAKLRKAALLSST